MEHPSLQEDIARANFSVIESRKLLETLVDNALVEWQIYHPNPQSENYMGPKEQEASIKYIISNIMVNMTPTIRMQIGIGYPADTDAELINSIKDRAKLAVLNYSIKQNIPKSNPLMNMPNINMF